MDSLTLRNLFNIDNKARLAIFSFFETFKNFLKKVIYSSECKKLKFKKGLSQAKLNRIKKELKLKMGKMPYF